MIESQQQTIEQLQNKNKQLEARLKKLEKIMMQEPRPNPDSYREGN